MSKHLALLLSAGLLALTAPGCGSSSTTSSSASSAAGGAGTSSASSTSSAAGGGYGAAASSSSSAGSGAAASTPPVPGELTLGASPAGSLMFTKKTLTAKAGTVTIAFTNTSPLAHNLTIEKGTSGPILGHTPTFQGGTKTLSLKLTPGTYTFFCSVAGHRAGGMVGTLTVK